MYLSRRRHWRRPPAVRPISFGQKLRRAGEATYPLSHTSTPRRSAARHTPPYLLAARVIPTSPPPRSPSRDKSSWCPAAGLHVPAHSHWRPPPSSAPDVLRPESTGGERDSLPPAPHQLSPTIVCASPSRTTVGDSLVHPPSPPPPNPAVDSGSLGGTRPCTNTGDNLLAVRPLFYGQRLRESRVTILPLRPARFCRWVAGCHPPVPQRRHATAPPCSAITLW